MSQAIAIVIPAYNEETRIGAVIKGIPKTLDVDGRKFTTHVVVVEDGSHDKTAHEAQDAGAIVVRHVINSGAGAATRTGLKYVEKRMPHVDYVVAIDADGQHAVSDIKKMVAAAEKSGADLVVGNRLHEGNKKDMPFHRTLGNRGLTAISRALFGIKVKDTQTGFRLFKTHTLPIVANYSSDRYGFATEMLWLATRSKMKIEEVPITVSYSSDTLKKGQNNWGAVDLIVGLLWVRISR